MFTHVKDAPPTALDAKNLADVAVRFAQCAIYNEMLLLSKTQCAFCDGYGHTYKICPTGRKLARCVSDTRSVRVMTAARHRAILANGEMARHKDPAYSFVSAIGKRTNSDTAESILGQLIEAG